MKYQAYTLRNFDRIATKRNLPKKIIDEIRTVGTVLPFKTNNYVVDELIDWDHYETDPMFILNFPQKGMLKANHYNAVADLLKQDAAAVEIKKLVDKIRFDLNPHPAGQMEFNVPEIHGRKVEGLQHKYRETMLVFPAQGQTCHAYCTFCFRWPQFTGMKGQRFALKQIDLMVDHAKQNPDITDILITGGDPMVMSADKLALYIDAILDADLPNIQTIRIGTKSLSFWPYRYLTDKDSDQILNLFRKVVDSGIHLSFMAHINHYQELSTDAVKEAVKKIKETGAIIRTQAPLLRGINDNADVWVTMWNMMVLQGIVPYYMFVARNTGSHSYFSVPLVEAFNIFNDAHQRVSGLARTVRGPSMSALPGKIVVDGIVTIDGRKLISLRFIQGRNPDWVGKIMLAEYDEKAVWIDDLKPAFDKRFIFQQNGKTIKDPEAFSVHLSKS